MTYRGANVPTEAEEQRELFEWLDRARVVYPDLFWAFHIPNGGSRNALEAHNLRLQGVKPGVPDIQIPIPTKTYSGLFIELKRQKAKGSYPKVTEEQKAFINALRKNGYKAEVCYGCKDAINVIIEYLEEDRK